MVMEIVKRECGNKKRRVEMEILLDISKVLYKFIEFPITRRMI